MPHCLHCGRDQPEGVTHCPYDGELLEPDRRPQNPAQQYLGRLLGGRYRVDRVLGAGSVGAVFQALDEQRGARVAIKLLMPRGFSEPRASRRLRQEFRALSRLASPHIVRAYDLSQTEEGVPFLVMEYVHGCDLADLLEREPVLEPARALRIALQILTALEAAHAEGIIHRDLKPDNVYISEDAGVPDFIKVIDFGLVKFFDRGEGQGMPTALTAHNLVVGTPHYMAPEQIRGGVLGPWTDLYALGALLYRMVTGELPFPGENPLDVMTGHTRHAPVPPRELRPELPEELAELILDLLEKNPRRRPRSTAILRPRLEALLRALSPAAQRPSPGFSAEASEMAPTVPEIPWTEASAQRYLLPSAEDAARPSFAWLVALVWTTAVVTGLAVALILSQA